MLLFGSVPGGRQGGEDISDGVPGPAKLVRGVAGEGQVNGPAAGGRIGGDRENRWVRGPLLHQGEAGLEESPPIQGGSR